MEPSLGERLRLARQRKRLSQDALGAAIGSRYSVVGMIELGKTKDPKLSTIAALAEALEVSPGWLAFGE